MKVRVAAKVEEETLVQEALANSRWAQQEIWYRFAPMVHGLLRRSLSARHDHEDLVQEVFLRVFQRLDKLEKPSALHSFIYSVAVRVVSEQVRRICLLQRLQEQLHHIAHDGEPATLDPETRYILIRIQRILEGMNDKHRAVFVLRHVEEMELHEIADGLDLSMATVKRYLTKAKDSIARWHSWALPSGARTREGLETLLGFP